MSDSWRESVGRARLSCYYGSDPLLVLLGEKRVTSVVVKALPVGSNAQIHHLGYTMHFVVLEEPVIVLAVNFEESDLSRILALYIGGNVIDNPAVIVAYVAQR